MERLKQPITVSLVYLLCPVHEVKVMLFISQLQASEKCIRVLYVHPANRAGVKHAHTDGTDNGFSLGLQMHARICASLCEYASLLPCRLVAWGKRSHVHIQVKVVNQAQCI